jgi:hypothetical protein
VRKRHYVDMLLLVSLNKGKGFSTRAENVKQQNETDLDSSRRVLRLQQTRSRPMPAGKVVEADWLMSNERELWNYERDGALFRIRSVFFLLGLATGRGGLRGGLTHFTAALSRGHHRTVEERTVSFRPSN